MKKNLIVTLALVVAVFCLSACGGGGSSSSASQPPVVEPPAVCVEDDWAPAQSTEPWWVTFTQGSAKCGTSREVNGTWRPWVDRAQYGASVAAPFKNYSGTMRKMVATKDGIGGSVMLGQDSSKKGALVRVDSAGNTIWTKQINPPMGTEVVPRSIDCDGNKIAVAFEGLPFNDWYIVVYDMDGNQLTGTININGPLPVSDDWRVKSAIVKLDGRYLVNSRIYQSGKSALVYADMESSATPVSVVPLVTPEFLMVDSFGLNLTGQEGIMQYDRALVAQNSPIAWRSASDFKIHDSISVANSIFTALTLDNTLVLSNFGNAAFRNTEAIPVGGDKVKLLTDVNGNMLVYIANRIGWLDKVTGEFASRMPVAVPANADAYISGPTVFFLENGNKLSSLPLSSIL